MRAINLLILLNLVLTTTVAISQDRKVQKKTPLSQRLINSTVKIESVGEIMKDGTPLIFSTIGTGFYYSFQIDSISIPCLVTNLHVVKNTSLNRMVFTRADSLFYPMKGELIEYNNVTSQLPWIPHPKYDLAILPLYPIFEQIFNESKTKINYISFDEFLIPNDSLINTLSAIETVLMIGYPKGYWDSKNNYPIVRRGTTATPIFSDFNKNNEFLLDIPIYPGSSGSPIILLNEGSYSDGRGGLVAGNRIFLLGIATQSIDQKNNSDHTNVDTPLNIAVVIKSSALNDFKPIISNIIKKSRKQKLR